MSSIVEQVAVASVVLNWQSTEFWWHMLDHEPGFLMGELSLEIPWILDCTVYFPLYRWLFLTGDKNKKANANNWIYMCFSKKNCNPMKENTDVIIDHETWYQLKQARVMPTQFFLQGKSRRKTPSTSLYFTDGTQCKTHWHWLRSLTQ